MSVDDPPTRATARANKNTSNGRSALQVRRREGLDEPRLEVVFGSLIFTTCRWLSGGRESTLTMYTLICRDRGMIGAKKDGGVPFSLRSVVHRSCTKVLKLSEAPSQQLQSAPLSPADVCNDQDVFLPAGTSRPCPPFRVLPTSECAAGCDAERLRR
jgi:hypothetical protein